MSHDDHERSVITAVDDNHVKKHLQYLFANTSKTDEDEIYPVTVFELIVSADTGFIKLNLEINCTKEKTRK